MQEMTDKEVLEYMLYKFVKEGERLASEYKHFTGMEAPDTLDALSHAVRQWLNTPE